MIEKITLDMLDEKSVSIKKQQYIEQDGQQYAVGQPWRKAYVNSPSGRKEVEAELPERYRNAIFAIWGDTPTVKEIPVEAE